MSQISTHFGLSTLARGRKRFPSPLSAVKTSTLKNFTVPLSLRSRICREYHHLFLQPKLEMTTKWADGPFRLIETPEFRLKTRGSQDQYVRGASIMAVVHNVIIRSLNGIYLQAPHVQAEDMKDFLAYCYCWYQYIDCHHRGEEDFLFPRIETTCGEKGLMDHNVEQHHEFEPGIDAYKDYILSLKGTESTFSAARLISIIDSFSDSLVKHLSEEIPTLEALQRFGPSIPFLTISQEEMRKAANQIPKTEGLPFFFLNIDRTFEGGLWEHWPPIPSAVRWALVRIVGWKHAGWWRFATCDYNGIPQKLYALD